MFLARMESSVPSLIQATRTGPIVDCWRQEGEAYTDEIDYEVSAEDVHEHKDSFPDSVIRSMIEDAFEVPQGGGLPLKSFWATLWVCFLGSKLTPAGGWISIHPRHRAISERHATADYLSSRLSQFLPPDPLSAIDRLELNVTRLFSPSSETHNFYDNDFYILSGVDSHH